MNQNLDKLREITNAWSSLQYSAMLGQKKCRSLDRVSQDHSEAHSSPNDYLPNEVLCSRLCSSRVVIIAPSSSSLASSVAKLLAIPIESLAVLDKSSIQCWSLVRYTPLNFPFPMMLLMFYCGFSVTNIAGRIPEGLVPDFGLYQRMVSRKISNREPITCLDDEFFAGFDKAFHHGALQIWIPRGNEVAMAFKETSQGIVDHFGGTDSFHVSDYEASMLMITKMVTLLVEWR